MNRPEVTKRLVSAVEKSALEFANIPSVIGEDVKDSNGGIVELGKEWKKFMQAQLDSTAAFAEEWISNRLNGEKIEDKDKNKKVTAANKFHQDGLLKNFEAAIDKARAHEKELKKDPKAWQTKKDKEISKLKPKRDKFQNELSQLQAKIAAAEKEESDVVADMQSEKDENKQKDLKNKKLQPVRDELSKLRGQATTKSKRLSQTNRDMDWWEPNRLTQIIDHLETDIKKFKTFQKATIKAPKL